MEVSGQLYAPTALPPKKNTPALIQYEAVWAPHSGVPRGGLGCSNPLRNSEDMGGVLDRISKKNRRLDFLS